MNTQNLDEIKKSFYSLFSTSDNDLAKLPKKGAEIKTGIATILVNVKKTKAELVEKMTNELGKIPFGPDMESYYDTNYKHLLEWIPKRYSYDLINYGEKYVKTENGIEEQAINKPTKEQSQEMREYNRNADNFIEHCIDIIKLETLKNNLEDKKTYNLSINQLTLLGL